MQTITSTAALSSERVLPRVFGWMCLGLAVSAITAFWTAGNPAAVDFFLGSSGRFLLLVAVELGLVIALSWLIRRLSPATAAALFLVYSLVNGLTLSVIVIAYADASLASAFIVTAGAFGLTAAYGYYTHRDLSRLGSIMFMGLIGLVLAGIVNMFVGSGGLDLAVSAIGVIIFTALTAYDIQKIKALAASAADEAALGRLAIFGALQLYLDFINIFLDILRLTGRRRK